MSDLTDEALARKAADGGREAFEELLQRHYDRIFRIAVRLLGNRADAEDVAQEVCIGLATKISKWRGESQFTTWLYRVVVNAAHDAMRRDSTRRRYEREAAESYWSARQGDAEGSGEARWLRRALGKLSRKQRETVILVIAEGLTHAEAAQVLGVRESTVSWRLHAARKRLRRLAEAERRPGDE